MRLLPRCQEKNQSAIPQKKLGKKSSVIRRNLEIALSSLNALCRPDTVQQAGQCDKATIVVLVALLINNKEEQLNTTSRRRGGERFPQEERTLHPHWPVAQPLYCEDERKHITLQQQPL